MSIWKLSVLLILLTSVSLSFAVGSAGAAPRADSHATLRADEPTTDADQDAGDEDSGGDEEPMDDESEDIADE